MEANKEQFGGEHYLKMPVQPWDVIDNWSMEQRIGFYRGNVIKYLLRAGSKGPAETDYAKAAHYMAKLDEVLAEGEKANESR